MYFSENLLGISDTLNKGVSNTAILAWEGESI